MNIRTITAVPTVIVLSVILAVLLITVLHTPASAHSDTEDHQQAAATKEDDKKSTANYNYVAQPGDSYSKIARKAIQTYGIKNKVSLSQGRILYAETNLTQEAGSPSLLQGQKVEIKESTVKNWVDKAKALSQNQAAQWNAYLAGVNFNTNAVGESR